MFNFSTKTIVNKELKVLDVFHQIKADKVVKDDAKKINSIVLSNIINSNRLNSLPNEKYKEIYVFTISLNTLEIPKIFIEALDKSIRFHTYFIFNHNNKIATMMCFKKIDKTVKLGTYYSHNFHNDEDINIPILSNVEDFYKFLYSYEAEVKVRDNENAEEFYKRTNLIKRLNYQISKTEKAIQYEIQPKKKFEYFNRLKEYKSERDKLLKEK